MNGNDLTIVSSRRRAFRDSNQFSAVRAMAITATTKDATTISSAKASLGSHEFLGAEVHLGFPLVTSFVLRPSSDCEAHRKRRLPAKPSSRRCEPWLKT